SATNPPYVRLDSQYIVRLRVMEDDNSCLFRAIAYTVKRNLALVPELRKIAAAAILQKPIDYNEAILGKPPVEYSQWIQKPSSWGGAIELAVFAEHYGIEICSIDVQTLRVDRFRPTDESKVNDRVIIIYSGIHFDAIAMAQSIGDPEDFDQTVFNAGKEGDRVLDCAVKVAEEMQRRRDFTDTANFTLKCSICKAGLKGQKDAITHANETGHSSFEEY
ncbi:OTU-domain-containing protein, partial [Ramicandelaber brevisporus]